jgi:hypothetical protein
MQNEIDVSKYTGFFHDGNLFGISKIKNEIAFRMSSAEVDPSEIEKFLPLSKDHRIQGVFHLSNIQSLHLTGEYKLERLFDVFDLGTILDFEIIDRTVELGILSENYPPKAHTNEFTTIVIQAERTWWENIPEFYYRKRSIFSWN